MKKYGKSEKRGGFGGFFKGKMGFSGVWGRKSRIFEGFRGEKWEYFEGFPLIEGCFWVKERCLTGKCGKRGVGCLELQRGQVVINKN